jgi:hypothetical protein
MALRDILAYAEGGEQLMDTLEHRLSYTDMPTALKSAGNWMMEATQTNSSVTDYNLRHRAPPSLFQPPFFYTGNQDIPMCVPPALMLCQNEQTASAQFEMDVMSLRRIFSLVHVLKNDAQEAYRNDYVEFAVRKEMIQLEFRRLTERLSTLMEHDPPPSDDDGQESLIQCLALLETLNEQPTAFLVQRLQQSPEHAAFLHDSKHPIWDHVAFQLNNTRSPVEIHFEWKLRWLQSSLPDTGRLHHRETLTPAQRRRLLDEILPKHQQPYNWTIIAAELQATPLQCFKAVRDQQVAAERKQNAKWKADGATQSLMVACHEYYGLDRAADIANALNNDRIKSRIVLRIIKSAIHRTGRWLPDEDERLCSAVACYKRKYGEEEPMRWNEIASCVPLRSDISVRERYVNVLSRGDQAEGFAFTEQEDALLRHLVLLHEHGVDIKSLEATAEAVLETAIPATPENAEGTSVPWSWIATTYFPRHSDYQLRLRVLKHSRKESAAKKAPVQRKLKHKQVKKRGRKRRRDSSSDSDGNFSM